MLMRPVARVAPKLREDLNFEDVSFCYDSERPILSDINMHVKAGTTVAIVGPTGSGKTTVVNLIPRFYDVSKGAVKVDGVDVRKYKQRSLRERIRFVLQDTVLFHGDDLGSVAYEAAGGELRRDCTGG